MSSEMTYEVRLSRSARKYYERCDPDIARQLEEGFEDLETTPFPRHHRIKKLKGKLAGNYRYRAGKLRVVFAVYENAGIVYVRSIGPRGDIY